MNPISEFTQRAVEATEADHNQAKADAQQRILDAPDCRVSKREMLGLNRKARSKTNNPLFGSQEIGGLFP